MSVQNAERMLRFMTSDADLRSRICDAGPENFEKVTAEVGASCSAYEVAYALAKRVDADADLQAKFNRQIPVWEA
ncbi:MAG: hypothetical protein ACE363_00735 [Alphaproteobacteria bacterium]